MVRRPNGNMYQDLKRMQDRINETGSKETSARFLWLQCEKKDSDKWCHSFIEYDDLKQDIRCKEDVKIRVYHLDFSIKQEKTTKKLLDININRIS